MKSRVCNNTGKAIYRIEIGAHLPRVTAGYCQMANCLSDGLLRSFPKD